MSPALPVGELAALGAALLWSATSIIFTNAGRAGSPIAVNTLKTLAGSLLFLASLLIRDGAGLGRGISRHDVLLLVASGLIGLSIGDSCLFRAFVRLGTRRALLINSLNPVIGALGGFLFLGERLGPVALFGMAIALLGVVLVIGDRRGAAPDGLTGETPAPSPGRLRSVADAALAAGIVYAVGAAFGQAAGALIIKSALERVDTLSATAIRMGAGAAGLLLAGGATGRLGRWSGHLARGGRMSRLLLASVLGPYIGVFLMMVSIDRAPTGVALTLLSTTPIWLLPLGAWFQNDRPSKREIAGALVAISGVALLVFR